MWVRRGQVLHVYSRADLSGAGIIAKTEKWITGADALKQLGNVSLRIPGGEKCSRVGQRSHRKSRGSGSYRAPLGPVSPKAARWMENWVRSQLPNVTDVADGANVDPNDVVLLWETAYQRYRKLMKGD